MVSFCPKKCNRVAHASAALGCKCLHDTILSWEGMPVGVENLATSDITMSMIYWNESSLKKIETVYSILGILKQQSSYVLSTYLLTKEGKGVGSFTLAKTPSNQKVKN